MGRGDEREQAAADEIGFPVEPSVLVFAAVEVVGGEGDEALFG